MERDSVLEVNTAVDGVDCAGHRPDGAFNHRGFVAGDALAYSPRMRRVKPLRKLRRNWSPQVR